MAYDRIDPIGPEPFDRVAAIERVQRRRKDEEERERDENRREQRERDMEKLKLERAKRAARDDGDDEQPHVDVRA